MTMNGWALFLLIALVLGIIVSNIMLLKHTANTKLPADVIRAIAERKMKEKLQKENKAKKPTDK